jgi:hypothetical protein
VHLEVFAFHHLVHQIASDVAGPDDSYLNFIHNSFLFLSGINGLFPFGIFQGFSPREIGA